MILLAGPASAADLSEVLDRYYPGRAREHEINGRGTAECTVTPDGGLTACVGVEELPAGWGFAEATARAAGRLQVATLDGAGNSLVGARVRLSLEWRVD